MCKEELGRINDHLTSEVASTETYTQALEAPKSVSQALDLQAKRDLKRHLTHLLKVESGTVANTHHLVINKFNPLHSYPPSSKITQGSLPSLPRTLGEATCCTCSQATMRSLGRSNRKVSGH